MATDTAVVADALAFVLAGGRGERLYPLTRDRTKGAVPFGGAYRLIDFTLSNCLHSGVRRICVLPQYRFASLERHLRLGWAVFPAARGESLALLPPQQRVGDSWYGGTADAVYQNLYTLGAEPASLVLVLSSDQVYRLDYRVLAAAHLDERAAVTIAAVPVPVAEGRRFGVVEVDDRGRVRAFREKPADPVPIPGDPQHALVSAGVYLFTADVLCSVLAADAACQASGHDFGHDVLPAMVAGGYPVHAFDAQLGDPLGTGADYYWRDIGDVDSYWAASLDLLAEPPAFDLSEPRWPTHTHQPVLPPARVVADGPGGISRSILAGGVKVRNGRVHRSILAARVEVDHEAQVVDAVLLDGVRVGPGARVRRAVVDKGVTIAAGCTIGCHPELDRARFHVSPAGIVVVPRGARVEPCDADADEQLARSFFGADDPASLRPDPGGLGLVRQVLDALDGPPRRRRPPMREADGRSAPR